MPKEAQLAKVEFHADRVVEALDDQAGTAARVEESTRAARPRDRDVMAAALPVALDRNGAVISALIIVRGLKRVAQFPHPKCRSQLSHPELKQADVRATCPAWKVGKRYFNHAVAARIEPDQDFPQHLKIG